MGRITSKIGIFSALQPSFLGLVLISVLACLAEPSRAGAPLGWINSQNPSAYTTAPGELSFSLAGLTVNDTLDFLNIREDLLAGDQRLIGDSGDLSGSRLELHYGITDSLSVFYEQQQHDVRLEFGEIASANILEIDRDLETTARSAGLRWTFFTADLLNPNDRPTALSLELSAFNNDSDDFKLVADELRINNLELFFSDPRTFRINRLQDSGWELKLLASGELFNNGVISGWLGYRQSDSTAGTDSDIGSITVASFFEQDFRLEEDYVLFGASLNFQINPRLPILLSYEFIRTNDSVFSRIPVDPLEQLPGFLRGGSPVADSNHTLFGRISYWVTPALSVSVIGNLYSNQFLGVLPHYSNPLSGSFADKPYGYAGIELSYALRELPAIFRR